MVDAFIRARRGTDAERLTVVFKEGELVYTTDAKIMWIGDGVTPGGIRVGSVGPGSVSWNDISGKPTTFAPIIGPGGADACAGNDARLSDARTPTAHNQGLSTITTAIAAGTLLKSDGSNPVAASVTESDVTANNAKVSFPGFGTTGSTACVGNDSRLSDARPPTSHNQGLSTITTAIATGTLLKSDGSNPVAASVTEADVTANNAKVSFPGFGSTGSTACVGNDSRLSDARTPTAHEATHEAGGADALPWGTVHGRGTTASKPAAASTNVGYLYYDTTLSQLQRSNGTTWDVLSTGGSGTPGGTTGQVQYNNGGAFGGVAEGTSGQVLVSNGPGVPPSFGTVTGGSGGGGGWGSSSQLTMTQQTTGLTAGSAVRFTSTTGDHALSNYQITLKAGTKSELSAELFVVYNASTSYAVYQWYNVTAAAYIGNPSTEVPGNWTGSNATYTNQIKALITVASDTIVELRVKTVGAGTITSIETDSWGFVSSTLPNASVTSQVIKKETVATNTTVWTVTLPVSCKALRITLVLKNGTASSNTITLGVNGNSTGHRQFAYSSNGTTILANEEATTTLGAIRASGALDREFTLKIADGETRYNAVGGDFNATDSLTSFTQYMRIAQSADISTLTFTGSQTNGIGAGSYIIVERVDADLSQDLGWQDYTPTCYIDLTSATTVPNITPSVRYRVQGKTLFMQGTLNFTGAPTGATDLAISLPTGVNVVSMAAASKLLYAGSAGFVGTGTYQGRVRLPGSTENAGRIAFRPQTGIGTTGTVTPTSPFTWANTHQIEFDFFTEIQ